MRRPSHICPPPKPPCPEGVLLPRIIAHEKRSISCLCADLCLSLPKGCTGDALHLCSVHASSSHPEWKVHEDLCGAGKLHIAIPVCARLRDACGVSHSASGMIEVETPLPRSFGDLCQHTLFIQPHIRLLCAEKACAAGLFSVQLALSLDLYLLSLQPCMMHPPKPACPQLPLYPPPMH